MWTPDKRNNLITMAVSSSEMKGRVQPYGYKVYPKLNTNVECDDTRQSVTQSLAATIYTKNTSYKYMSLGFYYTLVDKIGVSTSIGRHLWTDIIVIVKGSNAYSYLTQDFANFPFSDLDVAIYINPNLQPTVYNDIKDKLHIIVLQTLSQYKRILDNMFFPTGDSLYKTSKLFQNQRLFDDATVKSFKNDYKEALGEGITSPFEGDDERNKCSKNSFVMKDSLTHEDSIVKIQLPHFEMCEKIPLRRSPFFCSYNETINFKRDGLVMVGSFVLYRMKLNNYSVDQFVAADFIDVTISAQDDADQAKFWDDSRCLNVFDKDACMWDAPGVYTQGRPRQTPHFVVIPDVSTCLKDISNMLDVYTCPEGKREKRIRKQAILSEFQKNEKEV